MMNNNVLNAGYWSALIAFGATVAYDVFQVLQLYTALRFPIDEILIYGSSLCIAVPFVLAMLALHVVTPSGKQFWSMGAMLFTLMYAVFVTANYAVQLVTVIPAQLAGQEADIRVLVQTPHSLFWVFDALGYIFMGLAMLMALPAIGRKGKRKALWYTFLANGLVTPLISIVYFYPHYSDRLLIIGFPWGITAPLAMLVLALSFRKMKRHDKTLAAAKTEHAYVI